MKSLTGKQFAGILESKGWKLRRTEGIYHIYDKKGSLHYVSVPMVADKLLSETQLKYFCNKAGMTDDEL